MPKLGSSRADSNRFGEAKQKRWLGASPRLFRPRYPDFLHGAPPTPACAAFIKESRMKFANASSSTGNPEYAGANVGHPTSSLRSFGSSACTELLTKLRLCLLCWSVEVRHDEWRRCQGHSRGSIYQHFGRAGSPR